MFVWEGKGGYVSRGNERVLAVTVHSVHKAFDVLDPGIEPSTGKRVYGVSSSWGGASHERGQKGRDL